MRLFAVFLLAVSVTSTHWPLLSFDMVHTSFRSPAIIGVACAAISACGLDLGKALSRRCVFSGRAEALGADSARHCLQYSVPAQCVR